MGSGCCKTKIVDASVAVIKTEDVAATEIPYGYVFLYPGKPYFTNVQGFIAQKMRSCREGKNQ